MADHSTTDQSYWGKKGKPQPWYHKGKEKPFSEPKNKATDPDAGKRKTKTFAVGHNAAVDATSSTVTQNGLTYHMLWPVNSWCPSSSRPKIQPMSFLTTVALFMGSWYAVERFIKAIEPYPHRMNCECISCNTRLTFANCQTSKVDGTLRLLFNTSLPMLTFVDVLEQGQFPILLSIDQTRNLHMTTEHAPQYVRRSRVKHSV